MPDARKPDLTALGSPRRSAMISALLHAAAIILILVVTSTRHTLLTHLAPVLHTPIYEPPALLLPGSGGGGGQRSALPVPKGQPPKAAPRVFALPVTVIRDAHPLLEIPPEALGIANPDVPLVDLAHMGSLTGRTGPVSGGPGCCKGVGSGNDGVGGDKSGLGAGGDGGTESGGVIPKGMTKPVLLSQTEPEYSEEARKARLQGTVVLSIVVTAGGQVSDIRVVRSLGLGLDERAVEAVKLWRFKAGTADGKPVSTRALVEVNFRLL
jgi:TonB family protein